jgi:leader peptidase (prepilin peptidase) / N-methyltransferase
VSVAAAAFVVAPALALGSFLNVVAYRVPARRSLVRPRSACGSCGHEIAGRDNIPVLSYLLLRGRCRHCSAPISPVYPLVEASTAALAVACVAVFGLTAYAALAFGFCAVLVTLSVIDVQHRIVPNRIVLPAAGVVLVAHTAIDPSLEWALGALGASGFLFAAALAYPKGLGMGDVKLALLLGAMLGTEVVVALLVGLLAAFVPGIVLLAVKGREARKVALPFAPFLAFGGVVALFAGEPVLDWYLGFTA